MSNKGYKIVFLCHFSNSFVRQNLKLKNFNIWKCNTKFLEKITYHYDDFAIWVSDYIDEFEKHPEYEFHIVAPHRGMKKVRTSFEKKGIHYHFFKCDKNRIYDYLNKRLHIDEKNGYKSNRVIIKEIINEIQPNIVILCGAENPYYSSAILDVNMMPICVILQTLLNDPKRIKMGVGSQYRRDVEIDIFQHARYFFTDAENEKAKIEEVNHNALVLPVGFPTHRPHITIPKNKECDFVFFSRIITKNKGIEDLLHALCIVKESHKNVRLDIIGGCGAEYHKHLDMLIDKLAIRGNVCFAGYYENISDTYNHVVKARATVLPGITADLNSTVRESMLMGLPTICYASYAIESINREKPCLIAAQMENVDDLAKQMRFVLDNPNEAEIVAQNGRDYANRVFSNEAIVNELLDNCNKIINKEM